MRDYSKFLKVYPEVINYEEHQLKEVLLREFITRSPGKTERHTLYTGVTIPGIFALKMTVFKYGDYPEGVKVQARPIAGERRMGPPANRNPYQVIRPGDFVQLWMRDTRNTRRLTFKFLLDRVPNDITKTTKTIARLAFLEVARATELQCAVLKCDGLDPYIANIFKAPELEQIALDKPSGIRSDRNKFEHLIGKLNDIMQKAGYDDNQLPYAKAFENTPHKYWSHQLNVAHHHAQSHPVKFLRDVFRHRGPKGYDQMIFLNIGPYTMTLHLKTDCGLEHSTIAFG